MLIAAKMIANIKITYFRYFPSQSGQSLYRFCMEVNFTFHEIKIISACMYVCGGLVMGNIRP